MSDKESKFIQWLSVILGSFVVLIVGGAFSFYITTIRKIDVQDERIGVTTEKVETMRKEWREDVKEIKMNIDKIAEAQARSINYK